MSILWYLIQKEFKQIFRNKGMLPIIFILPILQLVILSNAWLHLKSKIYDWGMLIMIVPLAQGH